MERDSAEDVDSQAELDTIDDQNAWRPPTGGPVSWLDDASQEQDDDLSVIEYDIVSSPNDWNFATLVNFIESGALKVPAFQRNFVWDKKRASKLIESLLIGLPVPQVFLYEESRNNFIVIDGQQRLLTLYFFAKGRFPLPKIRGLLRPSLSSGKIDASLLEDSTLFTDFSLTLPKSASGQPNRYHGLSYVNLGEEKIVLDLRTMRNVVVKQMSPAGDSAMYEIFSRLNTGGVNLTPQEIRASLYHSYLIDSVLELNTQNEWRELVGQPIPDPRMRDTEFLLRSLALARKLDSFGGSMTAFVNAFCEEVKAFSAPQADAAISDLRAFFSIFPQGTTEIFDRAGKFSGVLFESFFAGWVRQGKPTLAPQDAVRAVRRVKSDDRFAKSLHQGSTKSNNIKDRIRLAEEEIKALI
ncbi:DUF262 domain-containing protein [Nocardia sp. CA2R105]|uniref:DUF262 domain-containing protein n=1 Tax=Nocardia coffeae TaxID=2873381 RepID=UPI001CA64A77|nr:DUF262 domain-containing protein [Nocardia coffeae]MBY8856321.1 DUF262 domain-containing protein [Nocardia coffeae]